LGTWRLTRTHRAKLAQRQVYPRLQRQRSRPLAVATTSHLRENPFELAREQLRRVGTTFEIDPNLITVLGECKKATEVSMPDIMNETGPANDLPAPAVGTDGSTMAWIFDTYSMNKGHSVLGVVTGKPLTIGGSLGRVEATSRGALFCIRDAVAKLDKRIAGMK